MTITREFFREQTSRLERQFNSGKKLDPLVQEEYFMTMTLFTELDLVRAIDSVIQTHRPYPGHIFPSISVIIDALNDIMSNPRPYPETQPEPDFCEQCRNNGLYLAGDKGRFCDCMRGRRKEIDFRFHPDKKRAEEEKGKIKGVAPPHRGIKEFNPVGFFEEVQEQYDAWMKTKRAEIDEIDARRARARESGAEGRESGSTGLLGAVKGALTQLSDVKKSIKEFEEDPEAPL
jgi:hypothetical protein